MAQKKKKKTENSEPQKQNLVISTQSCCSGSFLEKPSDSLQQFFFLRNCLRHFWTKLSVTERILSYLYIISEIIFLLHIQIPSQRSKVKMNSDRIEADGKNCFLHPNDRKQYHTREEARGTNGSVSLRTFCSIKCQNRI